jgi:hypothetical protein
VGVTAVETCAQAIRKYFDEKNRTWVTSDFDNLLKIAGVKSETSWWKRIAHGFTSKQRDMKFRKSKILRTHTRVKIRSLRKGINDSMMQAYVDEYVTFVYRDGYDYGVESRVIHHFQQWQEFSQGWVLIRADESDELHPIKTASNLDSERMDLHVERNLQKRADCYPYDRVRGLRYSELWWNGWNPSFAKLSDDCTNFISQCLFAGQCPMVGGTDRANGWWYKVNSTETLEQWSYSWTTAQALYVHLTTTWGAKVLSSPRELKIGDIIFYDWTGSGNVHHSAFVSDFDGKGDPLVNAHTDPSYHRHYLYLDSRAWTPKTSYRFVQIPDRVCK